ncbi:TetR/AcrR family transcriptional regulator [Solidesulfovibrio sp.]|uniref:TetR/AcrR family transcriptional regulator n=1 Tax=Solidesulfovibrio sp. TaxID=2910990 RepID=UPI002B2121AC|nr:TetR/AcrR family transcriptional regulator [Solidesulfovibrio sp.]MEA5089810.1 TetR/AcrR family transcriptional regulator [Solidesulfovibrio sp.]
MRTVKAPQERREEFLDAARELFEERGVDATSVSDIIEKVGVAKGTFYWHFKSKEALLDALAERLTARFLESLPPILAAPDRNALEKLRALWEIHERDRHSQPGLRQYFHKPENLLLHQKQRELEHRALKPLLASIIAQGNREGVFTVTCPETTADFLIMAQGLRIHPSRDRAATESDARHAGFREILERVLGTAPGSLDFLAPG